MGTMNVGKVSFGNAQPAAGTAQGAQQQQAPVKKADKGDVIIIGGKEITKKQAIAGGLGIFAAVAAVATTALSAHRGKLSLGEDAKLVDKIKEGFHTLVNKEARAEFAEKFGKKAKQAADAAGDKTKDAVADAGDKAKDAVKDAASDKGADAAEDAAAKTEDAVKKAAPDVKKAADAATEKVSVQDLVKAQKHVEAAETQVNKLKANMPADVAKPTAPTAPIKPVEPAKVKEPKNVVQEPVRKNKNGKTVKLSVIEKNNPEQLSKAEKQQLLTFKNYTERKAAWDKYQTDLAQYQTDMAAYTTANTKYKADLSTYNIELAKYEKYENAKQTLEAAEARLQNAKGNLSAMQKNASKEVRKAAGGLNGQTETTLANNVQKAMEAHTDAISKYGKNSKQAQKAYDNFVKAQDAQTAYLQMIGK